MQWSQELTRYDYQIKYRQGKKVILPDTLSRRNQNIPYKIGNNRLQTRFKRLILKTYVHHPPAYPKVYIKGKNPNYSFPK